jgi:hypothetical protein|nr:MAG TPA: hypothetical protein [Caudoviricetes sp.]
MNAGFIALIVGIAAAVVSQLYLKYTEKLPTQTVVLGDIPEANQTKPRTSTFKQCKPSHK